MFLPYEDVKEHLPDVAALLFATSYLLVDRFPPPSACHDTVPTHLHINNY